MKNIVFMYWKTQYCYDAILFNLIDRFNAIPVGDFVEIPKAII